MHHLSDWIDEIAVRERSFKIRKICYDQVFLPPICRFFGHTLQSTCNGDIIQNCKVWLFMKKRKNMCHVTEKFPELLHSGLTTSLCNPCHTAKRNEETTWESTKDRSKLEILPFILGSYITKIIVHFRVLYYKNHTFSKILPLRLLKIV